MTPSARSVTVFAVYLLLLGAVLLVAPNLLLQTFGLPPTSEVWIRVVGMLVTFLGVYYRTAAAAELVSFFRVTVLVRLTGPGGLCGAPPPRPNTRLKLTGVMDSIRLSVWRDLRKD
jgi:hypothetical protein